MAGWEVSRHPEWDLMYAAGLTVREIASWCHANVATVHLHLQVREKYTPGVRETHAAALARRDPDRPSTRWRKRLGEVLAFQEELHRLPDSRADGAEASLARWVALQRNAYQKGHMSAVKVILLDCLKGWELDTPKQRRDDHWRSLLEAVSAFVASTGQMPRYRTYESEEERVLGVWLIIRSFQSHQHHGSEPSNIAVQSHPIFLFRATVRVRLVASGQEQGISLRKQAVFSVRHTSTPHAC